MQKCQWVKKCMEATAPTKSNAKISVPNFPPGKKCRVITYPMHSIKMVGIVHQPHTPHMPITRQKKVVIPVIVASGITLGQ